MTKSNKTALIAMGAVLFIALIGILSLKLVTERPVSARPVACSEASPTAPLAPTGPKIRVGMILSRFNATGPHWEAEPAGYHRAIKTAAELNDPMFEVIPLIDTGTAGDPEIAPILASTFEGRKPIEFSDDAGMDTIKVIVAGELPVLSPEVLIALKRRVTAGAGLTYRQWFGNVAPGYTREVLELSGLKEGQFGWNYGPINCEVVASHPIIGTLKPGTKLKILCNGSYGVLANGTGLIKVKTPSEIDPFTKGAVQRDDFTFYPIYVAELGKGKIVAAPFANYKPIPAALNIATGKKFTARCVKWLAGAKLDD